MRLPAKSWTFWSTALLATPTRAFISPLRARQADDTAATFDWTSITPTSNLQYHSCYGTFQCARLRVPLDWSKETTSNSTTSFSSSSPGPYAAIAIVTLPATVSVTDPSYAGPILINPGGPGGSGAQMALGMGPIMQGLVDVPGVRHYDILGFDPRGVALTTPSGSCYESQFDRAVDAMTLRGMPTVLSKQGLSMRFNANQAVGKLCDEGVFKYLSTASVARDMLEIVDRSHELVMKATATGAAGTNSTRKACGGGNGEKPRLQYMGFSYGTILGNTFASMFPGRVGRMLLDGIADAEDYTAGTWEKNINDSDASVDIFYRTCFNAGADCPLHQSGDTSFEDIRARVAALQTSLEEASVATIYNNRIYTMTSYLLGEKIRTSLYEPIAKYEPLAIALAEALKGNFSGILADNVVMGSDLRLDVCSETPVTDPPQEYNFGNEVSRAIICGDSQASAGKRDLDWAASTVSRIANQSTSIGEAWTNIPLACADWPFTPPYTFAGPFGSQAPDNSTNTPAAPLLLLSTKTDHATPLANAYALSRLHEGASVAVVDAVGHCALLATTSTCMYGIVQEYFHTGNLPANGTVCEADCVPQIPFKACPGLPGA